MKKWLLILAALVTLSGSALAIYVYSELYTPVFNFSSEKSKEPIRIRKSWDLSRLGQELTRHAGLKDTNAFKYWMNKLGYKSVKPCFLRIETGMTMKELASTLISLRYQTVNVTIRGSMDLGTVCKVVSAKLEIDSSELAEVLKSAEKMKTYGFNDSTWPAMFIPNTYNLFVSSDADAFMKRMRKEYDLFWNSDRMKRAENQKLSPLQVSIIASIITKESNKTDEYEKIAGIYINRFRKGMKLQADPTVTYARGFEGRVLFSDLEINSPYNTYKIKGLPPGPICIPNNSAIEAVLKYTQHNYLYFCASPELNGYHSFSENLAGHNKNRELYLNALERLKQKKK